VAAGRDCLDRAAPFRAGTEPALGGRTARRITDVWSFYPLARESRGRSMRQRTRWRAIRRAGWRHGRALLGWWRVASHHGVCMASRPPNRSDRRAAARLRVLAACVEPPAPKKPRRHGSIPRAMHPRKYRTTTSW